MLLKELIGDLQAEAIEGDCTLNINGIAYDSRKVEPDYLFVAIEGFKTDGHNFIKDAVARGAVAVAIQKQTPIPAHLTCVRLQDTRRGLALMASKFYGYPCSKIRAIGVTGTNGKTTTTYMIRKIYEYEGIKTGLIGTIHNMVGEKVLPVIHTTPESVDLQKLLCEMIMEQVNTVVMEVSSHALALHRVEGCSFKTSVFTNISQDHLDFHHNMNDYLAAKLKLFSNSEKAVINNDDHHSQKVIEASSGKVITYAIKKKSDVMASEIDISPTGVSFRVNEARGAIKINLKLTGLFNVYNALAAYSVGMAEGFEPQVIKRALEEVKGVPGRFELVNKGQHFAVIVDYAHTPDGLENILSTAREFTRGRLITIFGCGGDRDRTKRPIMGQIGAELSDIAIITSDNPRTEEPEIIINDIMEGVYKVKNARYFVIPDRRTAIGRALEIARKGDVVIIAGKGHETYQEINGKRYYFDDREEASLILERLGGVKS